MAIPHRGLTGNDTYFITSATYEKINVFQTGRMAQFFLEVVRNDRDPKQIPAS
jgi:hypothetical protein